MSDENQYSWKSTIECPKDLGLEEIIKLLAEKNEVRLEMICEKKGWFKSTIDFKVVGDMNKVLFLQLDLMTTLRCSGIEIEIEK